MPRKAKKQKRSRSPRSRRGLLKPLLLVLLGVLLAVAAEHPRSLERAGLKVLQGVRRALPKPAAAAAHPPLAEAVPEHKNLDGLHGDITGEIDFDSLAPSLALIQQAPEGSTVSLHISSPGGNGFAMLVWLDAVDVVKAQKHVRLSCDSGAIVASAAAIIFETCDVRVAAGSTVWLFHGVSSMAGGKAGNVEDGAKLMRVLDYAVAKRIAGNLGMTPQQYIEWVDRHDRFLTTDELAQMDRQLVLR